MTQHDENLRIRHMRDHGREALDLVRLVDRDTFNRDRLLQLGLARLLEIVGEAAARTPDSVKRQHPTLPRREISDLRNRLIHGYDTIDLEIVWSVLNDDLPALVAQIESILESDG
jgi:uncharacterized protein with HEPN domain